MPHEENSARKDSYVFKQMYFDVKDENAITLEYFKNQCSVAVSAK
jgi:hypothetical protein